MRQAIFRWIGGKHRIARDIAALLPAHRTYVEPFGGAASVLLAKPASRYEVYNDLHGDAVNLFRVLQSPQELEALCYRVSVMPWSEAEYHRLFHDRPSTPAERAARFLFLAKASFAGKAVQGVDDGFRWHAGIGGDLPEQWDSFPTIIREVARRFKAVTVSSKDALRCIRDYDSPTTLFYVDPPYLDETRSGELYANEFISMESHTALLELINQVKGQVVISGRDNELYSTMLSEWTRKELRPVQLYNKGRAAAEAEVVWIKGRTATGLDLADLVEGG